MPPKGAPARQTLGRWGERLAALYLQRRGYRILERNQRSASGEIDIIAQDGAFLVFVEVRTRRGDALGTPEESVTRAKRERLIALAQEYLQARGLAERPWRIDLVAVKLDARRRLEAIDHVENITA